MNDTTAAPPAAGPAATALAHYVRVEGMRLPRLLLSAIAGRLEEGLGEAGMRDWCYAAGLDWAQSEQERFATSGTLDALADSLNSYWAKARWGWIELAETEDGLDVVHHASPVGDAHPALAGLLEGFYDAVFKLLGADPDMVVREVARSADGFDLHLRLTA